MAHPNCPTCRQFGGCFSSGGERKLMDMKTTKQSKPATQTKSGPQCDRHLQAGNGLSKLGPQTRAIHGGEALRNGVNDPVASEIYRTSTFTFLCDQELTDWDYG